MDLILPSFSWLFSQRKKKKSAANGPCMTQISQNIDNIVFVLTAILFTKEDIYISHWFLLAHKDTNNMA